jgi:hypothetical protein
MKNINVIPMNAMSRMDSPVEALPHSSAGILQLLQFLMHSPEEAQVKPASSSQNE